MQTILDCDGSICVPCMGTPVDCSTGTTSIVPCDDGDACTINDEQTVLDSDGTICVPCLGTPTDCSTGTTSIVACDDGDSNTTNDEQTILDCDGSICIPCQGIPVDCSNGSTSVVACDDGDACTINDEQTVLDSDGTICIPCLGIPTDCATGMTTNLPCDDGNPNTFNDIEIILACDGTICFPCSGTLCNVIAFIQDPVATLNCQSLNNGVILESTGSSTGPNLSYQWIFSNNTIGTGAAIEIFEEGNYTLLITDNSNGCFSSFDLEVTVPIVELIPTLLINPESCQNEADGSIIIDTVIGGQPPYLFSLNSGTFVSATQYQNLTPGNYDFTIQDADGCETFLELNVPAANALTLDLGPDEAINLGDSLQLAIFSNLIIDTIIWEFDESINCTNCLDPIVTPVYETQYSVTLIDINGCEISDQIVVFVDKTERIFIPNAFSPNGDGANDLFMIYAGSDVRIIRNFRIFDRWGASLFSRNNFDPNDSQFGWDGIHKGKVVAPGVYVYYAEIEFEDGRVEVKSGDVTVMK